MLDDIQISQTRGEKLTEELFEKLPRKSFRTYAEPRIMSGNTNAKPDFVVVCARYGVLVVEVKDWIRILGGNQKYIRLQRRTGEENQERNPYDIAESYAHLLAKRFEEYSELMHIHRNRRKLRFPWQALVVLPNIEKHVIYAFQDEGIWPKGCIWGKEDMESGLKRLEELMKDLPWKFQLNTTLNEKTLETINMAINPEIANVCDRESQKVISSLTNQQYDTATESFKQLKLPLPSTDILSEKLKSVSENNHVRLVRGVAGSGKTLVLSRRAIHLQSQHPDLRILVATFNDNLAKDLKKRIPSAEVHTFHFICRQIIGVDWHSPDSPVGWLRAKHEGDIQQDGWDVEFVASEIMWRKDMRIKSNKEYLDTPRKGREKALSRKKRQRINHYSDLYHAFQEEERKKGRRWMDWEDVPVIATQHMKRSGHPMRHSYDVVMIDEAQDFAPTWIDVIHLLLRPGGELFICDDPTQSIFRNHSWREKGIEVVGRTRILRTPFRCTRQISLAAHSLISADPILSQSEDIVQPLLESDELATGNLPELIAHSNPDEEVSYIEKRVQEMLEKRINPSCIAVLCHSKRIVRKWASLRNKGVYVDHFQKMKGLEFEIVFVPHLDNAFTDARDDFEIAMKRRAVFTAMTRARQTLVLSYHQKLPESLNPILGYVQRS